MARATSRTVAAWPSQLGLTSLPPKRSVAKTAPSPISWQRNGALEPPCGTRAGSLSIICCTRASRAVAPERLLQMEPRPVLPRDDCRLEATDDRRLAAAPRDERRLLAAARDERRLVAAENQAWPRRSRVSEFSRASCCIVSCTSAYASCLIQSLLGRLLPRWESDGGVGVVSHVEELHVEDLWLAARSWSCRLSRSMAAP
mmetsp:Transcript_16765/g.30960  ORF Transcript_16765/g.30960 Transcript_16765/m.30960 type:complete len:201 (+) Transcript_16765:430-1032(+)